MSTMVTIATESLKRYRSFISYNKELKETIAQKNKDIRSMVIDMTDMYDTIQDLLKRFWQAVESKESVCENLETVTAEKDDLYKKIEILRQKLAKKQVEMKNKVAYAKLEENNNLYEMIGNLKKGMEEKDIEMKKALNNKESVNRNLEAVKVERDNLYKKIENLKRRLKEKDVEMKKKVARANKNHKTITKELNKYKSKTEFEYLMKLNSDLIDIQDKIESIVTNNRDLLQTNDDYEIEMIKRKNAELYGLLTNTNVKTFILEKSAELKDAESELSTKKEFATQQILKVNSQLMVIKEEMAQMTQKCVGTIGNALEELQNYHKEVIHLEEANKKITESLPYIKIKYILLQQQNALMNEMIATNQQNSHTSYMENKNFPRQNFNEKDASGDSQHSNDENNVSIFDDDASETRSSSGQLKTFKLILVNVDEKGNKSDIVKVQKVLRELTSLSLDDIKVNQQINLVELPLGLIQLFMFKRY